MSSSPPLPSTSQPWVTADAFLEGRHRSFGERSTRFATETLRPLAHPGSDEEARNQARRILTLLGDGGWLDPIEVLDLRSVCLLRETLGREWPLADAVCALQALGTTPILLRGGKRLTEAWARPALRGRAMAGFAMTEEDAGSDVAAIATRARKVGDEYVLDGEKTFISNAGIADFYTVFASTDPDAGRKGLTCLVVPADAPGFEYLGPLRLSEPHPLGRIAFRECRIPQENRVGGEGEGLKVGLATLDRLRPSVAAAACGMAARALDEALGHASRRRQFGRALSDFQLVQDKLARMATELEAARLLTYRAAWLHDGGRERITLEASQAKAYATEAAQRVVDQAVQVLGGRGVLEDSPVDRLYRAVRALRIYEGTTEIQHLIIARHLLEGQPPGNSGGGSEPRDQVGKRRPDQVKSEPPDQEERS